MADIRGHAEGLKALDKPLKYKMTMITQWDHFNTFISNMALQDRHPCEIAKLFLVDLHLRSYQACTVVNYYRILQYFFQDLGWPDLNKDRQVQKLMDSFKRQRSQKTNQCKWPIILPILKKLCHAIKSTFKDKFYQRLYLALFTASYFGLFRFVEVIQDQRRERTIPVQAPDVTITETQVHIILRASKTTDAPALVILQARDDSVCPLQAIKRYLAARGNHMGVLFTNRQGQPMPWGAVTRHFEKLIRMCQLPPDKFSFHGFHVGRATEMFEGGATAEEIQHAGCWKSDAFQVYLRPLYPTIKQCIMENLDLQIIEKITETQATTKAAHRVLQSYKKQHHKVVKKLKKPILFKPPNHQEQIIAPRPAQPIWGSAIEVVQVPDAEFWDGPITEVTPDITQINSGMVVQVHEQYDPPSSPSIPVSEVTTPVIKKKHQPKKLNSSIVKISSKVKQSQKKKSGLLSKKITAQAKRMSNKAKMDKPQLHPAHAVKVDHTYTNKISETESVNILTKHQALQISAIFGVLPSTFEAEFAESVQTAAELPDSDVELNCPDPDLNSDFSASDEEINVVTECEVPQLQPQVKQPIMKKGKGKYGCKKLPGCKKKNKKNNCTKNVFVPELDGDNPILLPQ